MPALDAVDVFQHVFCDNFRLLVQVGGNADQRGTLRVVGVGKDQHAAGVPDQRRCFGKRKWVLGDITPDQVFIEGFLNTADNSFFYQVFCDVGSTEGTIDTVLYPVDVFPGKSFEVFFVEFSI